MADEQDLRLMGQNFEMLQMLTLHLKCSLVLIAWQISCNLIKNSSKVLLFLIESK